MPHRSTNNDELLSLIPNLEREAVLSFISLSSRPVQAGEDAFDALRVSMSLKAALTAKAV